MKNVVICFLSVFVSLFICTFFMSSSGDVIEAIGTTGTYQAFQIGAFKNYESALEIARENKGIVIKENDLFTVYLGVLSNSKNIEYFISYLNKHNIKYFIKNVTPTNSFVKKTADKEQLMLNTGSDVAFLNLNKKILDIYESEQ